MDPLKFLTCFPRSPFINSNKGKLQTHPKRRKSRLKQEKVKKKKSN
jgi:hypothetical protein